MIPEDIRSILEEQGLELVEVLQCPDTGRRRFYNLRVKASQTGLTRWGDGLSEPLGRGDLVIKVFGRGDLGVVSNFEKEARFLKLVRGTGGNLSPWVPFFVAEGGENRPWYIREFVKGDFLGDICFDFGIKKSLLTSTLLAQFLDFLKELHRFNEASVQELYLTKHGYAWYERDRAFYEQYTEAVSGEELKQIASFIAKRRRLLDSEARYLVHGDLYLKNMFWGKDHPGRLVVTDWELLHLGNVAFDLGFIWSLAWGSPLWREQLLAGFAAGLRGGDRQTFHDLFEVVILSVSLRFIRHSEIMEKLLAGEARHNAALAREAHSADLRRILRRTEKPSVPSPVCNSLL